MLKDYFDRIFVVSLKDHPRRRLIEQEFSALGLPFEFFDAVNGDLVSEQEMLEEFARLGKHPEPNTVFSHQCASVEDAAEKLAGKNLGLFLSRGILGCALSHLLIYEKALQEGYQRVLVCEDDIRFYADAKERFEEILAEIEAPPLNGTWDIIHWQSSFPFSEKEQMELKSRGVFVKEVREPSLWGTREAHRFYCAKPDGTFCRHVYRGIREGGGTCCYSFAPNTARYLLSLPAVVSADALTAKAGQMDSNLICLVGHPFPCYHSSETRSIINQIDSAGVSRIKIRQYRENTKPPA